LLRLHILPNLVPVPRVNQKLWFLPVSEAVPVLVYFTSEFLSFFS
jgi:hypothetical protein